MYLPFPFPKQALVFTCLPYKSFENTVGKGEIACDKQFLLFPQCFLLILRAFCHIHQIWNSRLKLSQFRRVQNLSHDFGLCNPLPDNKILAQSRLKAYADDKLNVTQNIKFIFETIENIVGKEGINSYQHFSFSNNILKRPFLQRCWTSSLCGKGQILVVTSKT